MFTPLNAWKILEYSVKIPVEHIMTERVKQNKSLVDIQLTARACQEHYQNQVDSFVIVSSDSDYWGLISSLSDARFLVMIEREKCGPDTESRACRFRNILTVILTISIPGMPKISNSTRSFRKCTAGLTIQSNSM